ncbi:DUF928 domain-containing protein [Planktothrix paucivesiculata]|uniref:DUF928 domain-containing protein n=1 Tax=Planktothrix paucivesiculata PCC 9631 TaxID=671071 RepID=A0A7Z9BU17_9CYAN|nr:DUF928 domain-containing protein [Planktothrix paucivesiculata]VXD21247.1 conserved exported hypothetical protein [Planktothrix paucivesiculata PCC 9631]
MKHLKLFLLFVLAGILIPLNSTKSGVAQHPSYSQKVAVEFQDPNPDAPNEDRQGSSSRTNCPAVSKPLTALIPKSNMGLTLSGYPTFIVYVPYSSNPVREVEFVLLDEEDNKIFQQKMPLTGTPGIVKFKLPPSAPMLEVGKKYRWRFFYQCNPRLRAEDDGVEGAIARINPSETLIRQLETATTPLEKIQVYAQNGLWYETLTLLALLRQEKPQDPQVLQEWKELLNSIGLESLADEPLSPCCKP